MTFSKEFFELLKNDTMKSLTLPLKNTEEENDILIAEFEKDNPDYIFASMRSVPGQDIVITYIDKEAM
jgi:hypothetical protein